MQAIHANGEDPASYEAILNHLANKPNDFFNRFVLDRTPSDMMAAYKRLQKEFAEMTRPDLNIYPNPTHDCLWRCPFKDVCILDNTEADTSLTISALFEQAPVRNSAYKLGDLNGKKQKQ